jgi:hypothetical protein
MIPIPYGLREYDEDVFEGAHPFLMLTHKDGFCPCPIIRTWALVRGVHGTGLASTVGTYHVASRPSM